MDDSRYFPAFQIIMHAGDSKSASMMAIEAARNFEFQQAREHLDQAEREMRNAHEMQIGIVQKEARGEPVDMNIILIHAQDHLTMAMMAKDHALELIHIYQMIKELKEGGNGT